MRYQIMRMSGVVLMSGLLAVQSLWAEETPTSDDKPAPRQYTYSWMFSDADVMKPRGGTTAGTNVVLDQQVSAGFQQLQSTELTPIGAATDRLFWRWLERIERALILLRQWGLPLITNRERPIRVGEPSACT